MASQQALTARDVRDLAAKLRSADPMARREATDSIRTMNERSPDALYDLLGGAASRRARRAIGWGVSMTASMAICIVLVIRARWNPSVYMALPFALFAAICGVRIHALLTSWSDLEKDASAVVETGAEFSDLHAAVRALSLPNRHVRLIAEPVITRNIARSRDDGEYDLSAEQRRVVYRNLLQPDTMRSYTVAVLKFVMETRDVDAAPYIETILDRQLSGDQDLLALTRQSQQRLREAQDARNDSESLLRPGGSASQVNSSEALRAADVPASVQNPVQSGFNHDFDDADHAQIRPGRTE